MVESISVNLQARAVALTGTIPVPVSSAQMADESAPPPPPERGPSKLALVAVALVAVLAGAGTAYALGHRGGGCPGNGNAVEVEGTKVSGSDFRHRIDLLRALYNVRPPADRAQQAVFYGDAAKGMAQGILVAHDVAKRHLQASDQAVTDALDRFVARQYPQGGRAAFTQALATYRISEDDVRAEFRRILETQALFEAVTADAKVTEDDVAKAFAERKDQLAVPEKRHLRHLVVATEDEANRALARVKGGEPFAAVAQAVSLDAATKDKGGDLGTLSRAQLDPAFGAAAFAAARGSTFGPVQTKSGWHVGLVVDVFPGHPVTLAEVHDSLKDTLLGTARLAEWNGYLAGRLRTADACYAKGNRPANPKAPTDATPSTLTPSTTG
jgi:peptidyl-prolyl cis-trans isomerase C